MAKRKTTDAEFAALADYIAGRITGVVPGCTSYRATIAETVADALAVAAAGNADTVPADADGALDKA